MGDGFVPVSGEALRDVERTCAELARVRAEVEEASTALLELAEDMATEAVRRLSERGASAAQIDRCEEAHRACADRMRAGTRALREACERVERAARALG